MPIKKKSFNVNREKESYLKWSKDKDGTKNTNDNDKLDKIVEKPEKESKWT